MSEPIEQIAEAVLAVPGVVALVGDPTTDHPATGSGHEVPGVAADGSSVEVHVQIAAEAHARDTAEQVQRAAHDVTDGRVDVTIEEVR